MGLTRQKTDKELKNVLKDNIKADLHKIRKRKNLD